MWIVPSFDELKNSLACFSWGVEAGAVEQLAFECGEEGFAHGVVIRVADTSHRRLHTCLSAPIAEGDRGVLAAVV